MDQSAPPCCPGGAGGCWGRAWALPAFPSRGYPKHWALLPCWASVPHTPHLRFSVPWVSWVGASSALSRLRHLLAPTPTGLSQQQAPLRQGDLHLQEDGGGVSAPVPPARPWAPTLDPTQWGPWGWFRPVTGDPLPHPFPDRTPTLLQLLQGDQADGAGQRPGHEHTLGGDFSGKRR